MGSPARCRPPPGWLSTSATSSRPRSARSTGAAETRPFATSVPSAGPSRRPRRGCSYGRPSPNRFATWGRSCSRVASSRRPGGRWLPESASGRPERVTSGSPSSRTSLESCSPRSAPAPSSRRRRRSRGRRTLPSRAPRWTGHESPRTRRATNAREARTMTADRFHAAFRCSEGCDFRAELTEVVYRCPRCQGLLEGEHDLDALGERPAAEWKALFDARFRKGPWPLGSGVWGKKEWVYPQLSIENVVSMYEGASPLLRLDRYAREIGLQHLGRKECGVTHTGSFKDLGMTVLVSAVKEMRARGTRIDAVACASTGDTSAALAAYCAAAGIPSVVLLPQGKISIAQLVQPISSGALVLEFDTDFDGCMKVVQELSRSPGIYVANSMNSLRIEGQKTLSIEVAQQLGWTVPDWLVIPGGNLGNASAVGRGFVMLKQLGLVDRLPRLAVAQAASANPLFRAVQRGLAAAASDMGGAAAPPLPPA